ncbi:MAG: hypothetical protein MI919_16330, partial [Holophagales bacterium]|nr:hypothetical protein [Holophagales bacterium]
MHRGQISEPISEGPALPPWDRCSGEIGEADVERAYRLAYFVHPEQSTALDITVNALAHLDDLYRRQDRRRYSRPRRCRTKVSRDRPQLLQHLICVLVSSRPLRYRMAPAGGLAGLPGSGREGPVRLPEGEQLLIRYVLELVRIGTRRSSFYSSLGISRILHDYSTAEAVAIHDFLIQDPERSRGESYFRRGKGLLLGELRQRFGPSLPIVSLARGELRPSSEGRATPGQLALVHECLRLLTPWGTPCPVPPHLDPRSDEVPALRFPGGDPDGEHPVELRRMHAVLHPPCFAGIALALGLDPPAERLCIPDFALGPGRSASTVRSADTEDTLARRQAPSLGQDDHARIRTRVLSIEAR